MLASNDNSYAKEYARRRQARGGRRPAPGGAAGEMLLTDRGEYIKFLESQLDAVTQACLTAQSFDERIVAAGTAAAALDEKILNLARLIKCAQGVAEEQERAHHAAMERVHERLRRCEAAVERIVDAENETVLRATSALRRKGLAHAQTNVARVNDQTHDFSGWRNDDDGRVLSVGVLDAQFRAWADARERDVDARVAALERRLAARVDDGVAAVLDAVRKAERRLREESPRLAEHAARRLWTAAGSGDGFGGGDAVEASRDARGNGAFPFLDGGVASGGSVRALAQRVEALETSEAELQALVRATRELQSTHAAEIREHRAREAAREAREAADARMRRAAAEETTRGDASEDVFGGYSEVDARAPAFDAEALARSVEASARGFERLGNQLAELQRRLDRGDAAAAGDAAARAREEKRKPSMSYRGSVPEIDDRRPAAILLAEAAALRAARDSVERARGIRVSRSPPASPPASSPAKGKHATASHVLDASGPKPSGRSEDFDRALLAHIQEETRSSLRGDADASEASMASEAEARREKLAGLYERLSAFSPSRAAS